MLLNRTKAHVSIRQPEPTVTLPASDIRKMLESTAPLADAIAATQARFPELKWLLDELQTYWHVLDLNQEMHHYLGDTTIAD